MKVSYSVVAIVSVVALTLGSASYRVSTAPDRHRLRLASARATCIASGGEWITVEREQTCRPGNGAKKL